MTILAALAGAFGIVQADGAWSFRAPDGKPFWSLGVCCTDLGAAKIDPGNPAYRALDHYPDARAWALGTQRDLRAWGFNSLGGWSDHAVFNQHDGSQRLPYFVVLHLGAYDKAPWNDMFAPQFAKAIDGAARDQIPKLRDDPKLVGYFTDNELGWWGDTLFMFYFAMPAAAPGKRALVDVFRAHYKGDFVRLQTEWKTEAKDFGGLLTTPTIHLKEGTNGIQVVREWMGTLARHYYQSVRSAVRKYDKTHLILGDRYCQYYDPDVARASRDLVDVCSTNLGAEWNDGTTSRFFLDTLHNLTQRPIVVSEFYMAAMENRSGNRNSSGGFPVVQTQKQRAAAFRRYIEGLARLPYVVGAHWFQFADEPSKGRGDGENYNMGLVDIHGKPYEDLVAAARALPIARLRRAGPLPPSKGIPSAPRNPIDGIKAWPRERAFLSPVGKDAVADLYAVREKGFLDLGLFAMDFADAKLYEGGEMPEADRSLWRIDVAGRKVEIRFGGDRPAKCSDPMVEIREFPGLKHTVIVRIPMEKAAVHLRSSLATHGRGRSVEWRLPIPPPSSRDALVPAQGVVVSP